MQVGGSFGTAVLAVILATSATSTTAAFHVAFAWGRRTDRTGTHPRPAHANRPTRMTGNRKSRRVAKSDRTRIAARGQAGVSDDRAAMLAGHGVLRGHVVVVVGVLRSRLAEPWTLSSLAEEVHLSHLGIFCQPGDCYV